VSDDNGILVSPEESGDEPHLISKKLPGVPVVVCGKRVRGAEFAIAEFGAQVIVLDDGFQHAALARDEDIVLIDCTNPFGFGRLLPRGLLREPLTALKRATSFVLTRADECDHVETVRTLTALNPAAAIVKSRHRPIGLATLDGARKEAPESISGKKTLAVSSIGNPEAFENTLRRLGADIVHSMRFGDHHRYSATDIEDIDSAANKNGAACIVTTEKDGVRLAIAPSVPKDLLLLEVELELIE
jgi:tetraacyldisaccharide 4'-kinase